MRPFPCVALVLLGCACGCALTLWYGPGAALPAPTRTENRRAGGVSPLLPAADSGLTPPARARQARGITRPAPGRRGVIAPVPLHPVVEVLVKLGDRVKKGQALVRLDDDEPRAEVRARRATVVE